jgi:outer membrane lipase/esterase
MPSNPRFHAAAAFAALVLAASAFGQNRTFTSQYSFGDSLSDSGNLFRLSGGTQPPPPTTGGRISSGPLWVEMLGNPILPAAGLSGARGNLNFAYAGATAGTGSLVPNLAQQIGQYRLQGLPAARTDLFTVLAGPNDLLPVLVAPTTPGNPAALDTAGMNAARSVGANVQALIGFGAKHIVVGGMPNLGATPRTLLAGGAGGTPSLLGLRGSVAFNQELRAQLQTLAAAAPDVNLVYLDLQAVLDRAVQDYRALGFTNASSYYLAPAAQGGGVGDPNNYMFWDDIHPTSRTHALLASVALEQLNPEPVLGFGATIGSAALRLRGIVAGVVDSRMANAAATERPVGRADVYGTVLYGDGVRAADGWQPKFGYDARAFVTGIDWRATEDFVFGAALDSGRLDGNVRGGRGDFRVENLSGRVYGIWRGGPVALTIDADYGSLRVKDVRRTTAFGGLGAAGKTSGDHWGVGLKAGWSIDGGGFVARPWFGLRTERVELDGFAERDIPTLAMGYEAQEAKSNSGAVGVDLGTRWKLAGRNLRLDFRAAWHGEIGNKTRTVGGRLVDNFTRPTTITVEDGDGDGIELGGAVTLQFARNWSTSLGYAGDIRSGERLANRVSLSVQTGF